MKGQLMSIYNDSLRKQIILYKIMVEIYSIYRAMERHDGVKIHGFH